MVEVTPCRLARSKLAIADLVLAGIICLAAAGYWLWDGRASSSPSKASGTVAESRQGPKNHFNDDGFRLFSASDYVGAERQFRNAILADPKDAVGFSNLGAALIAQRRFDEAMAALHTAIALDPLLPLARNNLNWALEEKAKSWK
jgi:tetratricopeptide (TPR) repeat protein